MRVNLIKTALRLMFLMLLFGTTVVAKTDIKSFLTTIDLQCIHSGMNSVDCIYVINLDYRPQKWLDMKTMFNSYGIFPNRVTAINGWLLRECDKRILMGTYPLMRGGEIGCVLSHVSALQHAFNMGYEVVWICEDDLEICEDPHQLNDLIAELSEIDPEWDVLYTDSDSKNGLGITVPSVGSYFRPDVPHLDLSYYLETEIINQDLIRKNQRFGAYSYIVSRKGVEKILRHFIDNYLWTAYDIEIHYVPGIRQYCVRRDLVSINWKLLSDTINPPNELKGK